MEGDEQNDHNNILAKFQKYQFKVILIGTSAVGKTSIITRYIDNNFNDFLPSTLGMSFKIKSMESSNGSKFDLKIWDTSGDERFRSVTKQYYRDSQGVVLTYDISSRISFDQLGDWLNDVKDSCAKDVVIVLVGNKKDLEDQRKVSYMDGKNFADKNGIFYFAEVSAKTGDNIPTIFERMGDEMIRISLNKEREIEKTEQRQKMGLKEIKYEISYKSNDKKASKCC